MIAVCDIDEEKAKRYCVPYFLDYHEMMTAHPEIDLVNVLVPTGYHARVVTNLAQYGCHILTEKPMALSVTDCDTMIRACEDAGVRLFVVYQNRYNDPVRAARRAYDDQRFGKMVMGTVRVRWCRYQSYYQADSWHGTWSLDGGVMSQQASHHLDLLNYFLGPVDVVQCQIATRLLDIEVEDTAVAIIRFKSGALGVFEATIATRPDNLEGSLSLLGEKGSVVIGGVAVNEIDTWKFTDKKPEDDVIQHKTSPKLPRDYSLSHTLYLCDVIRSIRDGIHFSSLCDGYGGRENVMILTALCESAASNGQSLSPGAPILNCHLGELTDIDY